MAIAWATAPRVALAPILLAYGEHVRRQRATAPSRARLASALNLFGELGART